MEDIGLDTGKRQGLLTRIKGHFQMKNVLYRGGSNLLITGNTRVPANASSFEPIFPDVGTYNSAKLPYYPGLGNGYMVKKMQTPSGKSSLLVLWEKWVNELKANNEFFETKSIVGELSNFSYEQLLLTDPICKELCTSIEIVFGDKIDPITKKIIIENNFLPKNESDSGKNKLKLYQYKCRPIHHKTMIDNKIFYEDDHEQNTDFDNFVVFENITEEHRNMFLSSFDELKNHSQLIDTVSKLNLVQNEGNFSDFVNKNEVKNKQKMVWPARSSLKRFSR